jgi:hypothetical protein
MGWIVTDLHEIRDNGRHTVSLDQAPEATMGKRVMVVQPATHWWRS